MQQPISEIARIRQQIDAEHEAAQRGMSGLAYGISRHDFINYRMEHLVFDIQQRREQVGDQEAFKELDAALDALRKNVASLPSEPETPSSLMKEGGKTSYV
ncbi:MAG: hypothetical protein JO202_19150 [Ktedonobacteraceae bacterium]|nr:hypothetical protein [Ktedonobacteraceae bacterium]